MRNTNGEYLLYEVLKWTDRKVVDNIHHPVHRWLLTDPAKKADAAKKRRADNGDAVCIATAEML